MTVATGNFPELLWPGIKKLFGQMYMDYKPVYTNCFRSETSQQAFEKLQGVTGLPLAGIKDQGGTPAYADPVQGFQKEAVHTVYALGSSVTREMFTDDRYSYIRRIPRMLARSMRQTEETVHANEFNNAFSTATAADGLSIINSAHVNAATGTTQSNQPSTAADLTQTSLEQAFIDIMGWQDDQDLRIRVEPKKLVVPHQLRFVAEKILGTDKEVGSADNDINPMRSSVALHVWTYLTDPDAWFVLTDQDECGFTTFSRWATQIDRDNEFDTQNLKFLVTKRWSQILADWHHVYASAGA